MRASLGAFFFNLLKFRDGCRAWITRSEQRTGQPFAPQARVGLPLALSNRSWTAVGSVFQQRHT
jgi:hypothetical protein